MEFFTRTLAWAALLLATLATAAARGTEALPPASNVVSRLIERSQQVVDTGRRCVYDKRSVTSELDANETPIKSTEKVYKVILVGGLPFQRLVKVQGKELTGKELERENQRENAFRQKISGVDLKKKASRKEALITRDLMDRFDFTVIRREVLQGRDNYVMKFKARANAAENTIEEKLLKRMSGQLWVDVADYELTKVEATMQGSVSVGWMGAIGALHRCELRMDRQRLPDGMWVNVKNSFLIVGRKLFTAMRFKSIEESTGFRSE